MNSRAAAAFYVREYWCRVGRCQTRAMRSANELKLTSKWPSMRRRFWNSTRPCTTNVSPITLSGVCIVMLELSLVIITLGAAVVVTTTGVGSCTYLFRSRPQERGTYNRVTRRNQATLRDRANATVAVRRLAPICAIRLDVQRVANSNGNNPKKTHLLQLLLLSGAAHCAPRRCLKRIHNPLRRRRLRFEIAAFRLPPGPEHTNIDCEGKKDVVGQLI